MSSSDEFDDCDREMKKQSTPSASSSSSSASAATSMSSLAPALATPSGMIEVVTKLCEQVIGLQAKLRDNKLLQFGNNRCAQSFAIVIDCPLSTECCNGTDPWTLGLESGGRRRGAPGRKGGPSARRRQQAVDDERW